MEGAPSLPCPLLPGTFSAGSTALITFNENSQVLPGNYPQEAHCQPKGERSTNKTSQNEMGDSIMDLHFQEPVQGASFLWEQGPHCPVVGPDPWAGLGGCPGEGF